MSNIINLLEAKSNSELQQQEPTRNPSSSRTVEELLKMLSGSSSKKPPPVPPKPSPVTMTLEAAKRTLGLNPVSTPHRKLDANETGDSKFKVQQVKYDTEWRASPSKTLNEEETTPIRPATRTPIGCVVYDSSTETKASRQSTNTNASRDVYDGTRPIVTEYADETNNNKIMNNRTSNASTVEILEVPAGHPAEIYSDDNNRKTFSKSLYKRQQQYLLNNQTEHIPVTASRIDNDVEVNQVDLKIKRGIKSANESTLNESPDRRPPRTSTPTSTRLHLNSSGSSSGTSTGTNNLNSSSQNNTYPVQQNPDSNSLPTDEEETLNISKETDELTNTSAHNQSGCELIGINDNSDPNNSNSNESPKTQERLPYTVQFFNDTTMSSSSPKDRQLSPVQQVSFNEQQQQETKDLKTLVGRMQDQIENMQNKITNLTHKVEDLESQLEMQKKEQELNYRGSTDFTGQHKATSSSPSMVKHGFSKSTSTINKSAASSNRLNTNSSPTATYSRQQIATISRNTESSPVCSSSGNLGSPNYGAGRIVSSRSCSSNSNSMSRQPLKKLNYHTSMSSLHAGGGDSVSPTNNGPGGSNKQSTSPNSLMGNLTLKRDPMPYTSMLSLNSIGYSQANSSTLRKASAIAGSVSNLSQVSTQLSQWPSMSNFVPAKHQAKDVIFDEDERVIRMVLYNTLITMRLPSWFGDDFNLDEIIEAPSVKLKLDWVHGYRGRDCRTNIYYLPTGECIYFVASIVVLYNYEEKKQRHYLGHTDSVKCLAIHPNKLIVASGQSAVLNRRDKRPIVRVWDTVNLATLRVIGFNEDFDRSICCLAFSKHDQGATLAVVDESNEHTITLLDWQREKNWRIAETNSGHEPVLAIDFHPIDKYSLVAVGKSTINFWDIRGMTLAKKAGLFDKYDRPKYVLCLTFNDLGDTITGDSNGNVIIWPRGSNRPGRIVHDVHPGGVFSVLAMKDGSYLTGGRDRRIIEWDEEFNQTGRMAELPEHCGGIRFITYARGSQVLIGTLRNSILMGSLDTNFTLIMQGHTEATSALTIHPHQARYVTGGFDEQVYLINAQSHEVEWSKCITMPATAACYSNDGQLIIIGSTQGEWLVLDSDTQEILFTNSDGSGTTNCVKFSPNGEFFAMGSSDYNIYIYQVGESGSKFTRIGTCVGHSGPIKELDWSDDNCYIQSQSMNFELLFWKANNCRPVDDQDIIHDLSWSTQNCSLGFNVIGIWSDSIDSALINYCDRSNNDELMATVTDTGFINLYKWPACYNQCLSQKYNGNVDKFNTIRFLNDDSKLIAVGAKSCVTTEWTIEKVTPC